jgi:hypothetical protein
VVIVVRAAALELSVLSAPALADCEDDLAAQGRWDHECLVQYYSGVIERMIEGQLLVTARSIARTAALSTQIQRIELEDFEITEWT